MSIYDTLNSQQKKAVLQTEGPVLILAGAGSGKTRVLTHRVAYLIDQCGINPWNIMAITFTNKAAGEMRNRVDKLVGFGSESIWVATFHSSCVRILRRYADRLGYDNNFSIYDTDDSKSVMKDICKRYQLETTQLKMRAIMQSISKCKDNLVTPEEYSLNTQNDPRKMRISKAYMEYQAALKKSNAMDFDDLLMKTVELFRKNPDVLEQYQERFRYIMVDEYQDTNNAQFELIRLLAQKYQNLCVVGDDDQSIYRFRGANIRNILDFEKVYPDACVIKLEQNYRSTQNILDAANAVIRNNEGRKDKSLWTDEGTGEKVHLRVLEDEAEEAKYIADEIKALKKEGKLSYSDTAVLYRTNAQSGLLESSFVLNGIPYDLVGGVNFFARREIKDLLCYLKTIDNARDDVAVRRIINVPKRGIGATTIENVQTYANERGISFYDALCEVDQIVSVQRAASKLKDFVTMISAFRAKMKEYSLEQLLKDILATTSYIEFIRAEYEDEGVEDDDNVRELNIERLTSRIAAYEAEQDEPSLSGFLEEVALEADIDSIGDDEEKVLLMTLHSAKGLEFEHVYIVGMEEGIFPSGKTLEEEDFDPYAMEEERRLAYVGITRAKKNLTLTSAKRRRLWGKIQYNPLSRFVNEIPKDLLDQAPPKKTMPDFLYDDGESIDDDDDIDIFSGTMFKKSSTSYGYDGRGYNTRPSYSGSGTTYQERGSSIYGQGKKNSEPIYQEKGSSIYGVGGKLRAVSAAPKKRAVPQDKPYIAGASKSHAAAAKGNGLAGLSKGIQAPATLDYSEGDRVEHVKYGVGTVKVIEPGPKDFKVTIEFDECGQKIMYAAFAKLKKI
ncbi:MAG: ATP-dependent DNA helicase PcrA [Butyrivibrio sp.]|jgi:DNA helicase-2/ATP-dependent DNA helicase PcrA|nr:ATP-dependent DNA helicase PcrA [Butyrivibrio sp.]